MTDFRALLLALTEKGVQFLLVGGVAAMAHGSSRLTQDVVISDDYFCELELLLEEQNP
jgi:hypothetical protein